MINICDLSPEIILYIFKYCDIYDLCRLCQCCTRFNAIITSNRKVISERNALVTNQVHKSIIDRCQIILSPYEKWRISHNWQIGRFKKSTFSKQDHKLIPWLNLDKDLLWISRGKYIHAYKRGKRQTIETRSPHFYICGQSKHDVVKFIHKNNILISGVRGGSVWVWSTDEERIIWDLPTAHDADVTCVDSTNDYFITGSIDEKFKVWNLNVQDSSESPQLIQIVHVEDRIWSIEISPAKTKIAIGSAGFHRVSPLHIHNLESYDQSTSLGLNFIRGSGVLDMHWQDDNMLLTCGYDTYLRRWDLRTNSCVQRWMDPHDSAYYCMASDDLHTVLCGSNEYGRVVLWDQRKSNYVQMYYTHKSTKMNRSSPVYSMSFDCCQLFTALDCSVASLNFAVHKGKITNYYMPWCQQEHQYYNSGNNYVM